MSAFDERTISCPRCGAFTLRIRISTEHDPIGDGYCAVSGTAKALCGCTLSEQEMRPVIEGVQAALQSGVDEAQS